MLIHSDWHIHSEASYDSTLPISEIERNSLEFGFQKIGITDHLNYNDEKFTGDLMASAKAIKELKQHCPRAVHGVELTPIEKPLFDHLAKHGTHDGYIPPSVGTPYPIELAMTKEELMAIGVQYAIGAAHWRVDLPDARRLPADLNACIKEWYRQQMWLACDERVTILGHPWYHGKGLWYEDFSVIPHSMIDDLASALKENGKCAECNSHFFNSPLTSEKFKHQYAEFLRELFERGIPITYGSDSHNVYEARHTAVETYLPTAGFRDGDLVGMDEARLWQ